MKIISPSVEFYGAVPTDYEGALRFIEKAGRTCYKSEDKITPDSAEKFVRKLIMAGHLAMVEHSNFVVRLERPYNIQFEDKIKNIIGKYLTFFHRGIYSYVGGSLTAWYQRVMLNSPKPVFAPFHELYSELFGLNLSEGSCGQWEVCSYNEIPPALHRYSAKFICDRGVSHELVRHRPCSFAQESTRYVNYAGKDMEFIEPTEFEDWDGSGKLTFRDSCSISEAQYKFMLSIGELSPQQARAVLPNALKTEIVVTADAAEWNHIRTLRTVPAAHPDMQRVMNMMPWEEFL